MTKFANIVIYIEFVNRMYITYNKGYIHLDTLLD
jgi:hypothetical protein